MAGGGDAGGENVGSTTKRLTIAFIGAKSVGKTSIIRVSLHHHHIIPDLAIDTVVEAIVQICAGSDGEGDFSKAPKFVVAQHTRR